MPCGCGGRVGRRGGARDKDPVVDIERLLIDYAWRELADPSLWDRLTRRRRFQLEVNWAYFDVSHRVVSYQWRTHELDLPSPKHSKPDTQSVSQSVSRNASLISMHRFPLSLLIFCNHRSLPVPFVATIPPLLYLGFLTFPFSPIGKLYSYKR